MTPEDKKTLLQAMISSIEIYRDKRADGHLIKTIHFTFPVTYDGESGALFVRTNEQQVETECLLVLRNPVTHINIDVDVEELVQDKRGQATYPQIKEYVLEQTGLHVTNLNIAQIKNTYGIL